MFFIVSLLFFSSCEGNYSIKEKTGVVVKFKQEGYKWKSWEGRLHLPATEFGSQPFNFSIDNNNEPQGIVSILDSAATYGWTVRLTYHSSAELNILANRGSTNNFVTKVEVLKR